MGRWVPGGGRSWSALRPAPSWQRPRCRAAPAQPGPSQELHYDPKPTYIGLMSPHALRSSPRKGGGLTGIRTLEEQARRTGGAKGSGRRYWGGGSPRFPRPTPLATPGGARQELGRRVLVPCIAPRAQGPISATHPSSVCGCCSLSSELGCLGHPELRKGRCGQPG